MFFKNIRGQNINSLQVQPSAVLRQKFSGGKNMNNNVTKNIVKGIGLGMVLTGGAALIGSMMAPTKKHGAKHYIESMMSNMSSMLK